MCTLWFYLWRDKSFRYMFCWSYHQFLFMMLVRCEWIWLLKLQQIDWIVWQNSCILIWCRHDHILIAHSTGRSTRLKYSTQSDYACFLPPAHSLSCFHYGINFTMHMNSHWHRLCTSLAWLNLSIKWLMPNCHVGWKAFSP